MTMSETPREPISMTGAVPTGAMLVSVTDAAAKKVLELRSREGKAEAKLRLILADVVLRGRSKAAHSANSA